MNQTGSFFARLTEASERLSPKTARVARFIESRYLEAAFMSTRDLAAAADVSLGTVVRFPRQLGYADIDDLRCAIQDQVNMDLTGVERLKSRPAGDGSSSGRLHAIIEEDVANLRALPGGVSESALNRFVDALAEAPRLMVLGFRYVGPLASHLGYSLNKIRPGIEVYTHADSTLYDKLHLLDQQDVVVAVAVARYPKDLVQLARYAHGLGRRILCVTDSSLSPLLPLAETALFAKGTVRNFVGSLAAPAALVNHIVSELGLRLGDTAVARLAAAEDAVRSSSLYEGGRPPGDQTMTPLQSVRYGLTKAGTP